MAWIPPDRLRKGKEPSAALAADETLRRTASSKIKPGRRHNRFCACIVVFTLVLFIALIVFVSLITVDVRGGRVCPDFRHAVGDYNVDRNIVQELLKLLFESRRMAVLYPDSRLFQAENKEKQFF